MMIQTEILNQGEEMKISMPEKFDFNLHRELRSAYESKQCKKYIIDLRNTVYMDSAALGMLLQLREFAGDQNDALIINNANENIREILKIANFEKMMLIN